MKELRWFVLKGVADELQKPAKNEKSRGKHPERMIENGRDAKRKRHHNQWYAKAMAKPVDRMSMTACVLGNPLFATASTKHRRIITQTGLPYSSSPLASCCGLARYDLSPTSA